MCTMVNHSAGTVQFPHSTVSEAEVSVSMVHAFNRVSK